MPCPNRVVLTVAGSDSSGGAGAQADLRTFAALKVHGLSAISAVTAQTLDAVTAVHAVPADVVIAQIDAAFDAYDIAVVKTGMLGSAEVVDAIVARACALSDVAAPSDLAAPPRRAAVLVVDPVLVSSSGTALADDATRTALFERLIPRCALVTPNLDELHALTGVRATGVDDMVDAARQINAAAVLVKGGHLDGDPVDVLVVGDSVTRLRGERITDRVTHGTGCTYAAAIAAHLARGEPLHDAVVAAHWFVSESIRNAGFALHQMHPFY